jgi:hypothetical protein
VFTARTLERALNVALLLVPLFFIGGLVAKDAVSTSSTAAALEAARVAQRLGEWRAPALSDAEREALLAERDACALEVERLEARRARPQLT